MDIKLLAATMIAAFIYSVAASAMRCGNNVIDIGDNGSKVLQMCNGSVRTDTGYIYKSNDGMIYTISVDNSGIISDIEFNRE